MTFSLNHIRALLLEHHLLKEFITPDGWHLQLDALSTYSFSALSYDSRQVDAHTLFFCKGLNFKEEYLVSAIQSGLACYVSEQPYEVDATCGIIVTDIRKAMAILSMAFYDYPQNELTLIGFTGTKGKTTAAYFTKAILDETTNNKTALLSTMNTTLDGVTYFKSHLTTPESLDLYRMMRQAVDNQMSHLVMEVSSQAYKTQRVYGLTFDIGLFLNISPDHISPIEHPTFDDYFYCKRQLLLHSKKVIIHRETDYYDLLAESIAEAQVPVFTYGRSEQADFQVVTDSKDSLSFHLNVSQKNSQLSIEGDYRILLAGDFNQENAASALLAAFLAGASVSDGQTGLSKARVPGRMDQLIHKNGASVFVDYAHNYLSLKNLLQFARKENPLGKLIVIIGSPGNKAISRRKDFGKVLSELADIAILTADDPANESPQKIADEIAAAITNKTVDVRFEMNRTQAIELALSLCTAKDTVVIAGKGVDLYQKVLGVDEPYEGDYYIVKRLIEE
ncbi:UDP-N-acetylmuramoyl-L-alanyl-D-glutamate--L-lysine ligase [Enterococcus phoeniculicola]|jgi:UDP-N-acetylmuramoyl-L-alanyl-D-glutamate-L-lysine ligase|uniref:UDP-N-acetylmuramoyl-L-alanyl-D-glutamate--L-lysine ligase n=1 Tax=Enterococcus phoeniculicola ATCC BAA-412 TaxID=1158610 RepID=R3U988_9ENTE|nr:UDP-N-acetylmuramoyl-L-alanyl-D-glutamate--L-lysine ligase [Enterococcus phoeniculicola]EOL50028.1 UDP-N-acetylmuramyl-tripeptide synthetase [Enterococcus phoeniculicola ATCC BAA-412]EOT70766.1 UDP-N-acetylmuramoylalanyl-D-glutamate-L- lysine ligase [Enterococcus phoeniculicola ATCC BAA-412]